MEWSARVDAGEWIAPRLAPFGTGAASVVPSGFDRYARVFHPAGTDALRQAGTPWSVVAAWSGATVHAASSWLEVALPERRPRDPLPWNGYGPDTGSYPAATSAALVEVLDDHTTDPSDVWAGVWEGWGDLAAAADAPRLVHPARGYLLRHGALTDTSRVDTESPWPTRPPNLWWPGDRSWCVASEIDADCTYIGGTPSLVADLVAHPGVEAVQVDPRDAALELTAPAWLSEVLVDARSRLGGGETVVLEVSRGTISARVRRPAHGRDGELTIDSVDDRGGRRTGSIQLVSPEDVDAQLAAALLWSAYELTV